MRFHFQILSRSLTLSYTMATATTVTATAMQQVECAAAYLVVTIALLKAQLQATTDRTDKFRALLANAELGLATAQRSVDEIDANIAEALRDRGMHARIMQVDGRTQEHMATLGRLDDEIERLR